MIFFYVLVSLGALVGMALGVLLPVLFPGFCFGGTLALLVGSFVALFWLKPLFFPIVGGVMAILAAVLSARNRYVDQPLMPLQRPGTDAHVLLCSITNIVGVLG